MFHPLKVSKASRQFHGEGFPEQAVEVQWPTKALVERLRETQPRGFYDLLKYHRPVYASGGHKGLTRKQRDGHRRTSWRRQFKH